MKLEFPAFSGQAPSGYYAWLQQPLSNRAPRVFLDLREAGETCSKHRVTRLMREPKHWHMFHVVARKHS